MIKERFEKRVIETPVPISKTCLCDICKAVIYEKKYDTESSAGDPIQYYRVTTGHHDWGNDSVDSIDTYDICSPECMAVIMGKYYDQSYCENSSMRNTEYITVEHCYGSICKEDK